MGHRSVASVVCTSLVLTVWVFGGACRSGNAADSRAQDMAKIDKLHKLDVTATLSGDVVALSQGMTDDVVILQQGQGPEIA
jgi:hypothetical protein